LRSEELVNKAFLHALPAVYRQMTDKPAFVKGSSWALKRVPARLSEAETAKSILNKSGRNSSDGEFIG
jgi:hypothetical protein